MAAKYILAVVAVALLVAGVTRGSKPGVPGGQARTFLLVGTIFAAVSAWLFYQVDWRQSAIDYTTSWRL